MWQVVDENKMGVPKPYGVMGREEKETFYIVLITTFYDKTAYLGTDTRFRSEVLCTMILNIGGKGCMAREPEEMSAILRVSSKSKLR